MRKQNAKARALLSSKIRLRGLSSLVVWSTFLFSSFARALFFCESSLVCLFRGKHIEPGSSATTCTSSWCGQAFCRARAARRSTRAGVETRAVLSPFPELSSHSLPPTRPRSSFLLSSLSLPTSGKEKGCRMHPERSEFLRKRLEAPASYPFFDRASNASLFVYVSHRHLSLSFSLRSK